ncbi:MAG: hypothetical protein V3U06_00445, partial [Candidatus Binatia bacterium]
MKKVFKIIGLVGSALVILFVAVLLTFYYLVHIGEFRHFFIREIEELTQMKVQVGEGKIQMGRVVG